MSTVFYFKIVNEKYDIYLSLATCSNKRLICRTSPPVANAKNYKQRQQTTHVSRSSVFAEPLLPLNIAIACLLYVQMHYKYVRIHTRKFG